LHKDLEYKYGSTQGTRLLRSTENPGGRRLSELLRQIRLEVEGRERGPCYAAALQVAGLLLTAEGVHEEAAAAGHAFDSFPTPRLIPAQPR
jgi:hypothetical protein